MGRFQRSWMLFKASMAVMLHNKQLIVFPIVIAVLMAVIVLFFAAPVALLPTGHALTSYEHWQSVGHRIVEYNGPDTRGKDSFSLTPTAMAYLAVLYLAAMFASTFLNVAFYREILAALEGRPVSIARGMQFATTRLKAIVMWSLLAGVVGLVIKALEERLGFIGRLVMRLVGVAWSVASVFAIPIIVQDEGATDPVATLKKSASILKKTWGEALIGYVGLNLAGGIVTLASLGILGVGVALSLALQSAWLLGAVVLLWLVSLLVVGYLSSVAGQIFKGALYLYAANGVVAQPYTPEMFSLAWKVKKQ